MMRMKSFRVRISLVSILVVGLLFSACNNKPSNKESEEQVKEDEKEKVVAEKNPTFPINRGINISHWLSQTERTIQERRGMFAESDVEFLARIGYDHIRLPIDEALLWDEQGNKIPGAWQMLHDAISWCHIYGMTTIVDLHIIRSHYFNSESNTLFTEEAAQERFINMWMELSAELKTYSTQMVAYELLNEAVADNHEDWNNLIAKTIAAIRKVEPRRKLVVGSNGWQNPDNFDVLKIPEGDKNIILSFHFYTPFTFTHYRTHWNPNGAYAGPVKYPGRPIEPEFMEGLPEELVEELMKHDRFYTRDTLEMMIQEPINFARKHDLQLYCGEFGAFNTVPKESKLRWYRDVRYIFEINNIAWANWDYKGGFAIFDFSTGQPDRELIEVLVGD